MPLTIELVVSDDDIERFRSLAAQLSKSVSSEADRDRIKTAAAELLQQARKQFLPQYIEERLLKLETLLNIVNDSDWQLDEKLQQAALATLAYFAEGSDLVSDQVPGLGFLDDAIYVELMLDEFKEQLHAYNEFCQFRIAESNRRRNLGLDPEIKREDWIADKRSVLHARVMNRLASNSSSSRGWYLGLFSP